MHAIGIKGHSAGIKDHSWESSLLLSIDKLCHISVRLIRHELFMQGVFWEVAEYIRCYNILQFKLKNDDEELFSSKTDMYLKYRHAVGSRHTDDPEF